MIVHDVAQRSPEWFQLRLGKLTGSVAADMMATIKSGEAAKRRNLRVQLMLERVTGRVADAGFQSKAMADGIEREEAAAAAYIALTGRMLAPTGFIAHDTLMAGCSLDGHVGDLEGIIEIKSPLAATHLEYLRSGKVPHDYHLQVVHNMWITGAKWCDWMSYQPDFPEALQVKIVRVHRNDIEIKTYELAASLFLSEVERECEEVRRMVAA